MGIVPKRFIKDEDYEASKRSYKTMSLTLDGQEMILRVAKALKLDMVESAVENPFEIVRFAREQLKDEEGYDDPLLVYMRAAAYYLTGDHLFDALYQS